jgi:death-on-curing protein
MFGNYLHEDLAAMAAAYLYHIAENQPFIDGNKRTALVAALAFLKVNGWVLQVDEMELAELVLKIGRRELSKSDAAEYFRCNIRPAV